MLPYIVLLASAVLLVFNVYGLYQDGIGSGRMLGLISNLLLIVAMLLVIRANRKLEN